MLQEGHPQAAFAAAHESEIGTNCPVRCVAAIPSGFCDTSAAPRRQPADEILAPSTQLAFQWGACVFAPFTQSWDAAPIKRRSSQAAPKRPPAIHVDPRNRSLLARAQQAASRRVRDADRPTTRRATTGA